MKANQLTCNLKPYPMEALAQIRRKLQQDHKEVYDFGTGDPKIPLDPKIQQALVDALTPISQYPGIQGEPSLLEAQAGYLKRRFNLSINSDEHLLVTTRGSKEAIFHLALSIVGRAQGRKTIAFPNPGYPVYRSSTLFAGGIPLPMPLHKDNNYLLEPWKLSSSQQKDLAALWVNYPHNPTGTTVHRQYWEQLLEWGENNNTLILSDDCYVDIFNDAELSDDDIISPIALKSKGVIALFSLSKRSGMTGYRSGFMVGDKEFLEAHLRARANMGLGSPPFIQAAARYAWNDDDHVVARRKIFQKRLELVAPYLQKLGLLSHLPQATFYLWCPIPTCYGDDDVKFCLDLAETGVMTSPSQWLGEGYRGYFRLALVPEDKDIPRAMEILTEFILKAEKGLKK